MPTYEIEQYEIHTQLYRIEAVNQAQAVLRLFDGDGEPVDGSLEYIEIATDLGLPVDSYPELTDQLRDLNVSTDDVVPTIRAIRQVE